MRKELKKTGRCIKINMLGNVLGLEKILWNFFGFRVNADNLIMNAEVNILGHSKLDFSFPSGPDFKLHAGGRSISIIHYSV
jgi:hypothetical protein